MGRARRAWLAALAALALTPAPLASCACAEMAPQPSRVGHCAAAQAEDSVLAPGCGCACMSPALEPLPSVRDAKAPDPVPAVLASTTEPLDPRSLPRNAPALAPDGSPPRRALFVLRV